MEQNEIGTRIQNLKLIIEIEEDNYKVALQSRLSLDALKGMRENIRKLKGYLQTLIEEERSGNKENPPGEIQT